MREVERYLPGRCSEANFGGRRGTLFPMVAAVAMTAVSVRLIITAGSATAWFGAVFFGLGVLVLLVQWVPGATGLRLEQGGLRIRSLFTETTIPWSQVREFRLVRFSRRTVGFVLRDESPYSTRVVRAVGAMLGVEGVLPGRYGFRRKDLVRLLEAWRIHFARQHAGDRA